VVVPFALLLLLACDDDDDSLNGGDDLGDVATDVAGDAENDATIDVADADGVGDIEDAEDDARDTEDDARDTEDDARDTEDDARDAEDEPSTEHACKEADGICVSSQAACTDGGGTYLGLVDCVFDDGDGACCQPPEEQETGDTCAARGGLCAPIAGCNFVDGAFAPHSDCEGVIIVCCVPEDVCGEETEVCCGDGVAFRPMCDRGTFTCDAFPDTTLVEAEDCPL
jgi:hypothetical protein